MGNDKFTARLVAYNRVTVPKSLIDLHDIHVGDFVEVELIRKRSKK